MRGLRQKEIRVGKEVSPEKEGRKLAGRKRASAYVHLHRMARAVGGNAGNITRGCGILRDAAKNSGSLGKQGVQKEKGRCVF